MQLLRTATGKKLDVVRYPHNWALNKKKEEGKVGKRTERTWD